ncbi:MAG: MOSC domain-containing protein [Anaerolineae bacterium]|nr:MOSC domain-containing protein [Gloeobacterales cyanobacterium ES-bin-313]
MDTPHTGTRFITTTEFEAALPELLTSPQTEGVLEMIVVRPKKNERRVVQEIYLACETGMEGDRWLKSDPVPKPAAQISLMNSRVLEFIAIERHRMALAGDNLIVDFDLSENNLLPGQILVIGEVLLEVTSEPHRGCRKFNERFGKDALKFINHPWRSALHLRGIYARVVKPGIVRVTDKIRKADTAPSM